MKKYLSLCVIFIALVANIMGYSDRGQLLLKKDVLGFFFPGYELKSIKYENSSGEKAVTKLSYNKEHQLISGLWQRIDQERSSQNSYLYNEHGYLISSFRIFSDSLYSYERFKYNENGFLTEELFFRSDRVYGSAKYVYEGNILIKAKLENFKGWLSGDLVFEYDSLGKINKGYLKNNTKNIAVVDYSYDSLGILYKEVWDFMGKWKQSFVYHYQKMNENSYFYSFPYLYCNDGFYITKEEYTYNNKIGGPSFYYYNNDHLLEKKKFIRSDSVTTLTRYFYDQKRRLTSSERTYQDGKVSLFNYFYDNNDHLILKEHHQNDSLIGFESYMYSNDGELISAYYENFDQWLTGFLIFQRDSLNRISNALFINQKSSYNGNIVFFYDINNKLSQIIWNFPNGNFQKYTFYYNNKQETDIELKEE